MRPVREREKRFSFGPGVASMCWLKDFILGDFEMRDEKGEGEVS